MDNDTISAMEESEYADDFQVLTDTIAPPTLVESQTKQLELLQHLSLYSELLILLSADRGMGKSFIAQALLATRESPDLSLMIEADISLSYVDILTQLAYLFAISAPAIEIEALENQILAHCIELSNNQQGSMLLVIDQADQMPDAALEDLNHLALMAPDVLHLMLIAPPELEEKLAQLPEPQAPVHVMNVEPFTDEEADALLLQSFPTKEWTGEEVNYILQQSAGNPGKILYIAQELLSGKQISASSKFPITHVAAMVFVLAALALAYLYYSDSSEDVTQNFEDDVAKLETSIQPVEAISAVEKAVAGSVESKSVDNVDKKDPTLDGDQQTSPAIEDEEIDFNFPETSQDVAVEKAQAEDAAPIKTEASKKVKSENKQIELPVKNYSNDEKMLLSHGDSGFVIQLFGSFSEKNAKSFIKKYANKEIFLSTYKTTHQQKTWHVVVAGPYENRDVAVAKSKKLPIKLQQQKPWIRSIVPVKEQITSFK
jgi:DamX protein